MASEIPVSSNVPNQKFSVTLGNFTLKFSVHYVARFKYYRLNIQDVSSGTKTLTLGRIANPNVDLLRGFSDKYGKVYISGKEPTLPNFGVTSKLMWEPPTDV